MPIKEAGVYDFGTTSNIYSYGDLYDNIGKLIAYSNGNNSFMVSSQLVAGQTYYFAIRNYSGIGSYKLIVKKGNPDLIVTDIHPSNTYAGVPIIFTATVKNNGTTATPSNTVIRVGFKINNSDTILWSDNYVSSIAPGASVTITVNTGVNGASYIFKTEGTYTVIAIVDDKNTIVENDETNNTYTKSILVGKADLVVTDITSINNYIGQPTSFNVTVKTQGLVDIPSGSGFRVGIKINGSDTILWTDNYSQGIVAGATVILKITGGINGTNLWTSTQASNQITAIVDDKNTLLETDETNNSLTKTITFVDPPDLIVTDINYSPSLPSAGENVSFSATIKNIGKGTSIEGIANKVEFSIDGGSIILWSDNYTHSIAPGQSVTLTVNMGVSGVVWNAVEGTHTVKAVVNGGNTIFESNTQNNSYSERMVITKPCDLIVTNIYLAPGNPIVGEPIKIKATIKNIGQGISPAGTIHRVGFYINGSIAADFWSDDYDWSIEAGQSVTVTLTAGESDSAWIAPIAGTYTIKDSIKSS